MTRPPKIHFCALVSVQNDADLLPHFIHHYDELGCDNYAVFLHDGPIEHDNKLCEDALLAHDWRVRRIPFTASFGDGTLKRVALEKFQAALLPTDYILCADADEFQLWSEEGPHEVMEQNYDIALGKRFDRFAEGLVAPEGESPLEGIYHIEHPDLSRTLFPKKPRLRDKIVMSRADVPVDFKKCAGLKSKEPPRFKAMQGIPIQHFKWREGIFTRLKTRTDYSPEEIQSIRQFFEAKTQEA